VKPRNAPPGPAFDRGEAGYWAAVKAGDFIGLRDTEAFAARLEAGGGDAPAQDYQVGEVRTFTLRGREGEARRPSAPGEALPVYTFIELRDEGGGSLYLCLVDFGSGFELRLYFTPKGLLCGTRDELIDAGETWLFLPPPDPEDFKSCDLEYAPYPDVPEIEEGGVSRKLLFAAAGAGKSLYGEASDSGASVIITEYAAEGEGVANPLLLVLEEGWIAKDGRLVEEGGYLTLMLGKTMQPGDIEHFPAQ